MGGWVFRFFVLGGPVRGAVGTENEWAAGCVGSSCWGVRFVVLWARRTDGRLGVSVLRARATGRTLGRVRPPVRCGADERDGGSDDRTALRALVEAYSFAADRRDPEAFAALFSEDATLTIHDAGGADARSYAGRAALAEVPQRLGRYDRTLHLVHNHDVHIDGDEASGEVYCTAHHVIGGGPDASDRVLTICYLDRYTRAGRWLAVPLTRRPGAMG